MCQVWLKKELVNRTSPQVEDPRTTVTHSPAVDESNSVCLTAGKPDVGSMYWMQGAKLRETQSSSI